MTGTLNIAAKTSKLIYKNSLRKFNKGRDTHKVWTLDAGQRPTGFIRFSQRCCWGLESSGRWRYAETAGINNPSRFSAPVQTGPGAHPASCTMGTGSFPEVKRPGRDVDQPSPSTAEVKVRVDLYLYSPSGPSWPVVGRTLPLPEPPTPTFGKPQMSHLCWRTSNQAPPVTTRPASTPVASHNSAGIHSSSQSQLGRHPLQ
jgi:hypothetical protein